MPRERSSRWQPLKPGFNHIVRHLSLRIKGVCFLQQFASRRRIKMCSQHLLFMLFASTRCNRICHNATACPHLVRQLVLSWNGLVWSSFIWNRIKATEESYQGFSLKISTSCRDLEKIFHRCLWDATPSNHETLWKKHTSCNKRQNHSIYHFIYLLVHADTSWDRVESCEWGALDITVGLRTAVLLHLPFSNQEFRNTNAILFSFLSDKPCFVVYWLKPWEKFQEITWQARLTKCPLP